MPFKTKPPLVIDSYTVLTLAIPFETFEVVSRKVEVSQRERRIELVQLHFRLTANPFEQGPVKVA